LRSPVIGIREKQRRPYLGKDALEKLEKGKESAITGEGTGDYRGKVVLEAGIGYKRFLELPEGGLVLRIC